MIVFRLFYLLAILAFFSACVPARKLVYLQKDDLKNRDKIVKDSILRTHNLSIREYRIQPLDLLSIIFETLTDANDRFNFFAQLSPQGGGSSGGPTNGVMVNMDGQIEYAVLGKIKLSGLTVFQAQDSIRAVASRFVPDVVVRVRMLNFRFTILGEVQSERTVVSQTPRLTLSEAIGLSGGLSELADRSNVKVIRQNGNKAEVYYIDLLKEDFVESPFYYVQQNDVIIVPPLKQRTIRNYYAVNLGIVLSTLSIVLFSINLLKN